MEVVHLFTSPYAIYSLMSIKYNFCADIDRLIESHLPIIISTYYLLRFMICLASCVIDLFGFMVSSLLLRFVISLLI